MLLLVREVLETGAEHVVGNRVSGSGKNLHETMLQIGSAEPE